MLLKSLIETIEKEVLGARIAYENLAARLDDQEIEPYLEAVRKNLETLEAKLKLFKKLES